MQADLPPQAEKIHIEETYPMVDDVSAKLVPIKSENLTFPRTIFTLGIYNEVLTGATKTNYDATGYGFSMGMSHTIRGMWKGGLDFRWSDWTSKRPDNTDLSPLSIYSKIEGAPSLNFLWGDSVEKYFQPFFTGGLGYTLFFSSRSWSAIQSRSSLGQFSLTYGIGFRVKLSNSFAINTIFENWRGIQTSDFTAQIYRMELVFGDVENY